MREEGRAVLAGHPSGERMMGRNETCKKIPSQIIPSKRESTCKGPEAD